MVDTCFIRTDGWSEWWEKIRKDNYRLYISIMVAFLGVLISFPIVRLSFYALRRFTSKQWEYVVITAGIICLRNSLYNRWTTDLEELMAKPSGWLIRRGLFWRSWVFGIPLLYWINTFGDVVTRVCGWLVAWPNIDLILS